MRLSPLLSLPFVLAIGLGAFGCSDGGETGTGGGTCIDYSKFDGMNPTVSFSADVLPIFRQSCGLSSSCHGDQGGPITQPFLGPPTSAGMASASEIDAIFKANVNQDAVEASGMKIVKPSDAANSFLMHKVDNSLTCPEVTCDGSACGTSMPQGSATLPQDSRDKIRRWILQGAKND